MPSPSFVLGVTVYDTDGSTAMADVRVTIRNESNNELQTLDTNASGEAVFNLANFDSDFSIGDVITAAVIYRNYEAYESYTVVSTTGGTTLTLTLEAISITQLRYCSVQDVFNYFNLVPYETDSENGVKAQQVSSIGIGVEQEIDSKCNTKFDDNDGAYYSETEYLDTNSDVQTYFLTKTPVSSVTTLATTQDDEETDPVYAAADWDVLTEDDDYTLDTETGRIIVVNGSYLPISRKRGLYAVYKYGMSSVPEDIRRLAILMIGRQIMKMSVGKALIVGRGEFTPGAYTAYDDEIKSLLNRHRRWQVTNTIINNP